MGRGQYNGYRGRPGVREILKITAVLLAVLGVLTAAVLLYAQRYIIYTDDGIRLELPFSRGEETSSADASLPVDIIQIEPEKTEQT